MSEESNIEQELDSHDARTDFKNLLQGILEKANAEERLPSDQEEEKDSSNEDFSKGMKIVTSSPQKPPTPRVTKRRKRRELQRFERQKSRDILNEDKEIHRKTEFFTGFRFTPQLFDLLLKKVSDKIAKQRTQFRSPISPSERLAATLRFLSTGDTYKTIGSDYCMSKSVLSRIIPDTCAALWDVLQPDFLPQPNAQTWKKSSDGFKYSFPHCVGALDGKYIAVHSLPHGESISSLVVMVVCDAEYRVLAVDVGLSTVRGQKCFFRNSSLGKMLLDQPLPSPQPLSKTAQGRVPYVFIGSEAFPLCFNVMKPYAMPNLTQKKMAFNLRLLEARGVAERAFGVMFSHFRVLRRPINLSGFNVIKVMKAIVVLHNFFLRMRGAQYTSVPVEDPVSITGALSSLPPQRNFDCADSAGIRDVFADHFLSQISKESKNVTVCVDFK